MLRRIVSAFVAAAMLNASFAGTAWTLAMSNRSAAAPSAVHQHHDTTAKAPARALALVPVPAPVADDEPGSKQHVPCDMPTGLACCAALAPCALAFAAPASTALGAVPLWHAGGTQFTAVAPRTAILPPDPPPPKA